jgi:hypothetical protein
LLARTCVFIKQSGERCRQAPLRDKALCFWHDPDHEVEASDARRLGGQRRKREGTLEGAYELEALDSVGGLRRVLEVVMFDAVTLENSVARGRLLVAVVLAGAKLLEVGELEERLTSVEAALGPRFTASARRR